MPRANIYLSDVNAVRVRDICEQLDFRLSNMVEAVALCLTTQELQTLRARYLEMKRIEDELDGSLKTEILALLKGMSTKQLRDVLASLKAGEQPVLSAPAGELTGMVNGAMREAVLRA